MRREVAKVIIGQEEVVDACLISVLTGQHALVEGVPGIAKTLLGRALAQVLDGDFKRIQFTPDLMPSDITGTEVIQEDKATRERSYRFLQGPVFANSVLAD